MAHSCVAELTAPEVIVPVLVPSFREVTRMLRDTTRARQDGHRMKVSARKTAGLDLELTG